MKIAIIGSGISGLTCGHLLADLHDITLFESDSRLGGHTHTHDIQVSSGHYKIDTGFIVCNDRNYPNFFKLMNKVGVEIQPSSMSFSVKSEMNNLEYNGTTLNSLFCQRRNIFNPTFYKMIFEILRFNKEATNYYLETQFDQNDNTTLENYLKENRYTNEFIEHYVMPMGAAIWSASREEMRQLPLKFFVRFFHHHGMLTVDNRPQWFVIKGGSSSYIPKLIEKFKNKIHLNGQVSTVTRVNDQVEIKVKETSYLFDEVIFATHADQTRKILQNQNPIEKEILNGFDYRPNDIFLHTDTSVLPKSKLGHASWNYFIPKGQKGLGGGSPPSISKGHRDSPGTRPGRDGDCRLARRRAGIEAAAAGGLCGASTRARFGTCSGARGQLGVGSRARPEASLRIVQQCAAGQVLDQLAGVTGISR